MGAYPNYTGYMLFLYLFAWLDAYLVAVIVKKITNSMRLAELSTIVFLVLYLYLDGAYFILETFSLCCGLFSLVLVVGKDTSFWRCLFSGACCALAFLSKQYGLLFAGVIGTLLMISDDVWKRRLLNCLYAFVGFCMIILLFSSLFMLSGLGLGDLIVALSGSTYGGQSLGMFVEGVIKSFRLFPYLLFVPLLLFNRKNQDRQLFWACCIGLLLASFQFYFNVFPHYCIFMLPFVLVLSALMWKRMRSSHRTDVCFLLFFGLLFTACALPLQRVYKDTKALAKHDFRMAQDKTTIQLRQTVMNYQLDSALCYWNTIQYYGLCPINPSSMETYGFAFGSDTEESYVERLKESDCFLVNISNLEDIKEMDDFSVILSERFHLLDQDFADGTKVFIREQ